VISVYAFVRGRVGRCLVDVLMILARALLYVGTLRSLLPAAGDGARVVVGSESLGWRVLSGQPLLMGLVRRRSADAATTGAQSLGIPTGVLIIPQLLQLPDLPLCPQHHLSLKI